MKQAWIVAPTWLKVLTVLGAAWTALFGLLGLLMLVLPGPGLLVLVGASIGVVPGILVVTRTPAT